jgi:hypothetical protein
METIENNRIHTELMSNLKNLYLGAVGALFDFQCLHCIIFITRSLRLNSVELEELIYEYGHVQYQIGRAETDEKANTKHYDKLLAQKQKIQDKFQVYFIANNKSKKFNS